MLTDDVVLLDRKVGELMEGDGWAHRYSLEVFWVRRMVVSRMVIPRKMDVMRLLRVGRCGPSESAS